MEIGIAVPCHESDVQLLGVFGSGLSRLKPQPSSIYININDGSEGMRKIVSSTFSQLFDEGCDVVLKASVDFYLSEHILAHVRDDMVVSFTPLAFKLFDFTFALHRILMPSRTWSGCYSIPKQIWYRIQDEFDGQDTSIMKAAGKWKVKSFQYRLLRPYREDDEYQRMRMKKLLRSFPLWKRLLWQLIRFKAVKL